MCRMWEQKERLRRRLKKKQTKNINAIQVGRAKGASLKRSPQASPW